MVYIIGFFNLRLVLYIVGLVILNKVVIVVDIEIVFSFWFLVLKNIFRVVFVCEKFVVFVNVNRFCFFVWVILFIFIGNNVLWVLNIINIYYNLFINVLYNVGFNL